MRMMKSMIGQMRKTWSTKKQNLRSAWATRLKGQAGGSRGESGGSADAISTAKIIRVRILTLLFSSLIGSTFLAAILVAPGIILYFFWYKPSRTEFRHRVTLNVQAWLFWAAANLLISWCIVVSPRQTLQRF
jgi:hypothetical protein